MPTHQTQHLSIISQLPIRILQPTQDAEPGALSDNPISKPQGRKSFKGLAALFYYQKPNKNQQKDK
jgi:hypothetical protein